MTKENNHRVDFDWKVFDACVQFKVTKKFVADYMGVSEDTIENRLREKHDMTYTEYNKIKLQRTGLRLQQKAIEMAMSGNATMMIFALKNVANWQDKIEQVNIDDSPVRIEIVRDDNIKD